MFAPRMAEYFLYVSNITSKGDGNLCFHKINNEYAHYQLTNQSDVPSVDDT